MQKYHPTSWSPHSHIFPLITFYKILQLNLLNNSEGGDISTYVLNGEWHLLGKLYHDVHFLKHSLLGNSITIPLALHQFCWKLTYYYCYPLVPWKKLKKRWASYSAFWYVDVSSVGMEACHFWGVPIAHNLLISQPPPPSKNITKKTFSAKLLQKQITYNH